MLPPGRRKGVSLLSLSSLLLLVLFATSASAASAVLGIDLGTEYIKAALVKPGTPLDIVLTKDSRRKEAAAVAFKPSRAQTTDPEAFPERLYGADAVALTARFPEDVYPNLKSLLGISASSSSVKDFSTRFPGLSVESVLRDGQDKSKATVGFKSKTFGQDQEAFMVEELLAMELQNIKANAEAAMPKGSVVTDAVITYPPFYTAEEKRALELAMDLSGLRMLAMISDGAAIGLNYATARTFDSVSEGANPEYHLVYDMGAGSTTATIIRFQGKAVKDGAKKNKTIQEVQAVGVGWDRTLGGDVLNQVIVDDMVAKFLERPKIKQFGLEAIHVKKDFKAMARFWKEAERLRQVLSANSRTSASFEGIYYEDVSFQYKLSRTGFETLAGEFASRVSKPVTMALESAGLTLEDVNSVILHGGAVRTPFVQKELELVAGGSSKIKTNVNSDEAAVMGAAFKAATLSSSFRVKDIRAAGIGDFTFTLKWSAEGKARQQKMFSETTPIGAEKELTIKSLENTAFEWTQTLDGEDFLITSVDANNITASVAQLKDKFGCAASNITTKFKMHLSPMNGLPAMISGSVSCESASKEGSVMDNVKGLFGFGSKKDSEQDPLTADDDMIDDATTMTPLPLEDATSSGSTISSASLSTSTSTKSAKSTKSAAPTSTIISIPLAFVASPVGLNTPPTAQLPRIRQRLDNFAASDRSSSLRSEALNTLEGFTYRARDYLTDSSFVALSSDKVREELEQKLNAASEWLYGEGVDAKLKDFQSKLKELKGIVDPVLARKEEGTKRGDAVKSVKESLEQMDSMIKMVQSSISTAAEEAVLAASSAASAGSESASSVVESVAEKVTGEPELGDELEDDPYGTSVSSSSGKAKPSAMPAYTPPSYTDSDLAPLQKSYDSVKAWLDEKLALQEKLTPYDDPAVLVKDLELRAKQLQTEVTNLIMKNIRMPGSGGGSSSSSSKKSKTSSTAKKPKSKKTKSGSTTVTAASVVDETSTAKATASKRAKDEL